MRSERLVASLGILPALWWMVFCISNTLISAPPSFGPVTAVNALYVAMMPAVFLAAMRPLGRPIPGFAVFVLLFVWVMVGLLWRDSASGVSVAKRLLIYGLFGFGVAQLVVGSRRGAAFFGLSLILTSTLLSLWTVGYALHTGFAYRSGVPINPNWPATLIGPGLIAALACYLGATGWRTRAALWSVICLSWYASLLLGSRGILLALVSAIAVLWWQTRPAFRSARILIAGVVAVTVLAQVPSIPYGVWRRVVQGVATARESLSARPTPAAVPPAASPAAPTASDVASPPTPLARSPRATDAPPPTPAAVVAAPPPVVVAAPPPVVVVNPKAAESTALARFGEVETASLNLRKDLWVACVNFMTSGPVPLFVGGGVGKSQILARQANPVFDSSHNSFLQIAVDFGLLGLALFLLFHVQIARALLGSTAWTGQSSLAGLVYWAVAGLTATVTDQHVFWLYLGVASATAVKDARQPSETPASVAR